MFGRRASQHLQRLRWMEGRHGFRTGPRQLLSRCLFVLGRLRHCLPLLETNTNCTLAPGLEMCSWGHVAKNSNACSHEWRAHSTIALVFTKAWHGQKKKKGHFLATATNVRVGYKAASTQGGWTAGSTWGFAHIWTNLLNRCHRSEHFAGKCHMKTARRPVFVGGPAASALVPSKLYIQAVMAFHAWVELQLSLYDTKAAYGSTWLEPWII